MKKLPDSELELMMIIWNAKEPISRMEIEKQMDQSRKVLPSTILSFLSRLEEKGFVKVEKRGKINFYSPLVEQEHYLQEDSKTILAKMYHNSLKNFITAFYHGTTVNQEEIEELQQFLDEFKD